MSRIFHFISRSDLAQFFSDGSLRVPSLQSQGFIHCSLAEQVTGVANAIASARDDLLLLEIDESKVIPKIVYENLEGGEKLFPHIYGPLNEEAIIGVHSFVWTNMVGYILPNNLHLS